MYTVFVPMIRNRWMPVRREFEPHHRLQLLPCVRKVTFIAQ